jgi:hypothetical protein
VTGRTEELIPELFLTTVPKLRDGTVITVDREDVCKSSGNVLDTDPFTKSFPRTVLIELVRIPDNFFRTFFQVPL